MQVSDEILLLERRFQDPGWVYDPETGTCRQRRVVGVATPGSDEEAEALERIDRIRQDEEIGLLPAYERRRAERRRRLWAGGHSPRSIT